MMFYEIVLRLNHTGDNFQAIALCFFPHWLQSCPCVTGRKEGGHNHVGSISGKSGESVSLGGQNYSQLRITVTNMHMCSVAESCPTLCDP